MAKPEKHSSHDDGNSEKELIDLLKTVLSDMFKEVHGSLHAFQAQLIAKETKDQERHLTIMTALETLTASVTAATTELTDLTTAVNAAVVELGADTPTDAQLLTLAAAIDANTANAATLAAALNNAVTPPVVPVP